MFYFSFFFFFSFSYLLPFFPFSFFFGKIQEIGLRIRIMDLSCSIRDLAIINQPWQHVPLTGSHVYKTTFVQINLF